MSNIVIISGGMRPSGNTPRIARVVEKELKSRKHNTHLIDLAETVLPLWDEGTWGVKPLDEKWGKVWAPLAEQLEKADGLVILAPEYHGMVPSALQNLLMLLGNGTLVSHKPALLIGVSASTGGLYPVSQLRLNGSKNNRMLFLPDHLAIRDAGNMFTGAPKPEAAEADAIVTERLHWNLTQLEDYIEPMKAVRAKGHASNAKFANGM
ncbi:MAG TPA: NAD(P)H-dependent oxidoreductase [Alphaproteobacteria bacterium]|nr:NAD(P)H-dependent oxidoreductase [Alphaproteobacteria bacterium]